MRARTADTVLRSVVSAHRWPAAASVLGGLALGSVLVSMTARMRGLPGVLALLVAVVVATRVGPVAGLLVAAGTGVVNWWQLAGDPGRYGLFVAVPLWSALAWVSGIGAAQLRQAKEQRQVDELELRRRALHDPLTGLPNRRLVMDRLQQAQQRAHRHETLVAVLFLDLDNFKTVNDSLGHVAGDRLLTQVAQRLLATLRGGDTAGRVGGDEFVVICEDLHDDREATAVAQRLSSAMTAPFQVSGRDLVCTVSIGIALTSVGAALPEDLLRDADLAMYHAKRHGQCHVMVFDSSVRAEADERRELELALSQALHGAELRVVYQPITDLATSHVVGVEALVRWQHPTRGLLLPGDFLDVAEDSGLIVPIGRWVLHQALQQGKLACGVG